VRSGQAQQQQQQQQGAAARHRAGEQWHRPAAPLGHTSRRSAGWQPAAAASMLGRAHTQQVQQRAACRASLAREQQPAAAAEGLTSPQWRQAAQCCRGCVIQRPKPSSLSLCTQVCC
jgi:hypothetical protein